MKVGIDQEKISRMSQKLLDKIATEQEKEYVYSFKKNFKQHIASLWTAKEAVIKILGKNIGFLDIEIIHDIYGKPFVKLLGEAKNIFENAGLSEIDISITHTDEIATAVVIAK